MKTVLVAVYALVCIGSSVWTEDVAALIQQLKSSDSDARRAAAATLATVGPEAKAAVPALIQALRDKDMFVRRFSAQALGAIGRDAKGAAKALSAALKDPKKEVVRAAAEALAKIGAVEVLPLASLVKDKNQDVQARCKAAEALGAMRGSAKPAVPALVEALNDRNVRIAAAQALGRIGPDAAAAVEPLQAILTNKRVHDRNFKRAVANALKQIRAK